MTLREIERRSRSRRPGARPRAQRRARQRAAPRRDAPAGDILVIEAEAEALAAVLSSLG
jgi:hypothetical protein